MAPKSPNGHSSSAPVLPPVANSPERPGSNGKPVDSKNETGDIFGTTGNSTMTRSQSSSGFKVPRYPPRVPDPPVISSNKARLEDFLNRQEGASASGTMKRQMALMHRDQLNTETGVAKAPRGADAFRTILTGRFGTLTAAWRQVLDKGGNGKVSFTEFCQACRDCGYGRSVRKLWLELDADNSGFITLDELDSEASKCLQEFRDLVVAKLGSSLKAWHWFDKDKNHRLDENEFIERCEKLGQSEPKKLFRWLKTDSGKSYLTIQDFDATAMQCLHRGDARMMTTKSASLGALKKNKTQDELLADSHSPNALRPAKKGDLINEPPTPKPLFSTTMTKEAKAGEKVLEVADTSGFAQGDRIVIGNPDDKKSLESNRILKFGSIVLLNALKKSHPPGTVIKQIPAPAIEEPKAQAESGEEPISPKSKSTPGGAMNGSTMTSRWIQTQSKDAVLARKEEKAKAVAASMGLSSLEGLKHMLVVRFGSMNAAWKKALDLDGNGRLSFGEFCTALRDLGYVGNVKAMFIQLDQNKDGFITMGEFCPETDKEIGSYKDLIDKKYNHRLDAWLQSLDPTGHGQIDEVAFTKHCQELGWKGKPKSLFMNLKEERTHKFLTLREYDVRAYTSFIRGDMEMLAEEDSKKRKKPSDMSFNERQDNCFNQRWARAQAKVMRDANAEMQKAKKDADVAASDLQGLKVMLLAKFGTIMVAWKKGLDFDANGKLSFGEFCEALRKLGYNGHIKKCFDELSLVTGRVASPCLTPAGAAGVSTEPPDRGLPRTIGGPLIEDPETGQIWGGVSKGFITLEDLHPHADSTLKSFRKLLLWENGTFIKAWYWLDKNKNGSLEVAELEERCQKLGWEGPGPWDQAGDDAKAAYIKAEALEGREASPEDAEEAAKKAYKKVCREPHDMGDAEPQIYITGLPTGCDADQLKKIFSHHGQVVSSRVLPLEPAPGSVVSKTSATGIVCMGTPEEADWVVDNINGTVPDGLPGKLNIKHKTRGDAQVLFLYLIEEKGKKNIQMADIDPAAAHAHYRGHLDNLTREQKARRDLKERFAMEREKKESAICAHDLASLKVEMIRKHGNIVAAWKHGLDYDGNGRLAFVEFAKACRNMSYLGCVRKTFKELDSMEPHDWVTFDEWTPEWSKKLADFKKLLLGHYGTWSKAWKALDENGNNMSEEAELAKVCKVIKYEGDVHKLFKHIVCENGRKTMSLEDLDLKAHRAMFISGDAALEGWTDKQKDQQRRFQLEAAKAAEHQKKVGAKTLDEFKKLLCGKYGSLPAAWRQNLDKDGNSRLSYFEFVDALKSNGYIGSVKDTWNQLGKVVPGEWKKFDRETQKFVFAPDKQKFVYLDDFAPEEEKLIKAFEGMLVAKYTSIAKSWKAIETNGNGFLEEAELLLVCKNLGFEGDVHQLFVNLRANKHSKNLVLSDLDAKADHMMFSLGNEAEEGLSKEEKGKLLREGINKQKADQKKGALGAQDLKGLKKLLLKKYGSLAAAWTQCMDNDGNGKLSYGEFCTALRRVGFEGNLKDIWKELDVDDSKLVSFDEFDGKAAEALEVFRTLLLDKYEDYNKAWKAIDPLKTGKLLEEGLEELCKDIGYPRSSKKLFGYLKSESHAKHLTLADLSCSSTGGDEVLSPKTPKKRAFGKPEAPAQVKQVTTTLTKEAKKGDTILKVKDHSEFKVGDKISIGSNEDRKNGEDSQNMIDGVEKRDGFGSIILASALKRMWPAGTTVKQMEAQQMEAAGEPSAGEPSAGEVGPKEPDSNVAVKAAPENWEDREKRPPKKVVQTEEDYEVDADGREKPPKTDPGPIKVGGMEMEPEPDFVKEDGGWADPPSRGGVDDDNGDEISPPKPRQGVTANKAEMRAKQREEREAENSSPAGMANDAPSQPARGPGGGERDAEIHEGLPWSSDPEENALASGSDDGSSRRAGDIGPEFDKRPGLISENEVPALGGIAGHAPREVAQIHEEDASATDILEEALSPLASDPKNSDGSRPSGNNSEDERTRAGHGNNALANTAPGLPVYPASRASAGHDNRGVEHIFPEPDEQAGFSSGDEGSANLECLPDEAESDEDEDEGW